MDVSAAPVGRRRIRARGGCRDGASPPPTDLPACGTPPPSALDQPVEESRRVPKDQRALPREVPCCCSDEGRADRIWWIHGCPGGVDRGSARGHQSLLEGVDDAGVGPWDES